MFGHYVCDYARANIVMRALFTQHVNFVYTHILYIRWNVCFLEYRCVSTVLYTHSQDTLDNSLYLPWQIHSMPAFSNQQMNSITERLEANDQPNSKKKKQMKCYDLPYVIPANGKRK